MIVVMRGFVCLFWVLVVPLVLAAVGYVVHRWWFRQVTTVNCIGSGETAICSLTHVCYHRNDRHMLYGHIAAGQLKTPYLLAYLIASDIFPQSAIYLNDVDQLPANQNALPQQEITLTNQNTTYLPNTFLLYRFKPDNVMHVLHDDILPTYASLSKLYPNSTAPFPVSLAFADKYGEMPYDELYESLTQYKLLYNSTGLCFHKLNAGFDKSSLWYQYGFREPQGPIPHNHSFINSLITKFVSETKLPSDVTGQVTLFSRQETRLILNEGELMARLSRELSLSVKVVDMETHTLPQIIECVSKSSVVIGMHGALMSTILWMSPGSLVLELFPFAVNPSHYTPYKTLAEILGLKYVSWANMNRNNTVGHSDYPKEYGGLEHLPVEQQKYIEQLTEVEKHLCCDDPSWLYHIYQDTVVEVDEVAALVQSALS